MSEVQTMMIISAAEHAGNANGFIYGANSNGILVAVAFIIFLFGIIVFTDIF